jgi:hypothetical protein
MTIENRIDKNKDEYLGEDPALILSHKKKLKKNLVYIINLFTFAP